MQKKGEKHKTIVGYVLKTSALSISVEKLDFHLNAKVIISWFGEMSFQ